MSKKSVVQGICDILGNEYDRLKKKYPDASYRDIINKMPPINEVLDELLVYYDKDTILNFFDSDDLLDAVSDYEIIDKAKQTGDWDSELEDAVESEICSRELMTWEECDEQINVALSEKPVTYKDMTPDDVWEHFYDFLGIPYNNVNDAEAAFDEMCDKMGKSTYAHEFIKNEMKK